jgi:hypothetical protein
VAAATATGADAATGLGTSAKELDMPFAAAWAAVSIGALHLKQYCTPSLSRRSGERQEETGHMSAVRAQPCRSFSDMSLRKARLLILALAIENREVYATCIDIEDGRCLSGAGMEDGRTPPQAIFQSQQSCYFFKCDSTRSYV